MWMWMLIGLNIITKVHGYASDPFSPETCDSMLPLHKRPDENFYPPQTTTESPFTIDFEPRSHLGEPITVVLKGDQTTFRGFMLEARERGMVDNGRPVGKFITLDSVNTEFQTCHGSPDSAVRQRNNVPKATFRVNWTALGEDLDVIFKATFVHNFTTFWMNVTRVPGPPTPSTTTAATTPTTTTAAATTPTTTTAATTVSATAAATAQSTATSNTESSTGNLFTTPLIITPTNNPTDDTKERAGIALMCFNCVFKKVKMELSVIFTVLFASNLFYGRLHEVFKIAISIVSIAIEISSMILFCSESSCDILFVALVCVVIVINFIEVVITSLPIGPGHKLKEICDFVCFAIHNIFTTAVIFIGVLETDKCGKSFEESWLQGVMAAFTAWNFLSIIWAFIFIICKKQNKTGSFQHDVTRKQQNKKNLSAAEKIVTANSVIFIVGTTAFAVAVTVGLFWCKES